MIPDREYKLIMNSLPIPTVDLIILSPDSTKTLLFLRKNKPAKGFYYTIGGRIIKGESPEDAIVRVADTEAGLNLNVKNVKFTGYGAQDILLVSVVLAGVSTTISFTNLLVNVAIPLIL